MDKIGGLVVVVGNDLGYSKRYYFDQKSVSVGAYPHCDVRVPAKVPHEGYAQVVKTENGYIARAFATKELTSIKSQRGSFEVPLRSGDFVRIGYYTIVFYIDLYGGGETDSSESGYLDTEIFEQIRQGTYDGLVLFELAGPEMAKVCELNGEKIVGSGPEADFPLNDPEGPANAITLMPQKGSKKEVRYYNEGSYLPLNVQRPQRSLRPGDSFAVQNRTFEIRHFKRKHPRLRSFLLFLLISAVIIGLALGGYYWWIYHSN